MDWDDAGTKERLRLLKGALLAPLRAWRDAGVEVARVGTRITAASGVPARRQRWEIFNLILRHGMKPSQYAGYGLYLPERRDVAHEFVQAFEYFRVVRWYNEQHVDSDAARLIDKLKYEDWCIEHGLPTAPTLLEFRDGTLVASRLGDDLDPVSVARRLPDCDLFSKPTEGTGGHGVVKWRFIRRDGPRSWESHDGRVWSAEDLLNELARTSATLPGKYGRQANRIMLQRCMQNHRDLAPITTTALCTVRVVTYRMPGEKARTVAAAFRMATGDAPADNFSSGGVAVAVDPDTGRLKRAVRVRDGLLESVERHPDTGVLIEGFQLPLWREAVELAERGLDLAKRLPSIGWDIGLTDDGPVLIEANPASHPGIAQRSSGFPLGRTPLPTAIDAHIRSLLRE